MPFFSVIVPHFNKEKYIENTLHSILAQSFSDYELIIINDGSTDNSEQIVKKFTDQRIKYYSRKNEGVSAARNFCISVSTTDYIAFIDADDYWHPNFLARMHSMINQFPASRVFASAIEIQTDKIILPAKYSVDSNINPVMVDFFEASKIEPVICTSASVFSKEVFEKAGLFDTEMINGEDIDLWIRIGMEFKIVFTHEILARYVYDPKGLSKKKKQPLAKPEFYKFIEAEKSRPHLKKYLDLNRYSLAIKAKIVNDVKQFDSIYKGIDTKNLSPKKRILLGFPPTILRALVKLQLMLAKYGLASTVFK